MTKRFSIILTAAVATVCVAAIPGCGSSDEGLVLRGAGSYTTVRPAGLSPPLNGDGAAATPLVSPDMDQLVTTHKWWASLVWPHGNAWSSDMWVHPLVAKAEAEGLLIGYPTQYEVTDTFFFAQPRYDLLLGADSLQASETRVVDYGDWTVTAQWPGARPVTATLGRGLPTVWIEGGRAQIRIVDAAAKPEISIDGDTALLRFEDRTYAAFAPTGTSWSHTGDALHAPADVYALSLLPDARPETVALFRNHAFNIVRDTRVSWDYNKQASRVTTKFAFEFEQLEPDQRTGLGTLTALYRHQWLYSTPNTSAQTTGLAYGSPRGEMRLVAGSSFETSVVYGGVLPRLPDLCLRGGDARLEALLQAEFDDASLFEGIRGLEDTYFSGKAAGRMSELISLARAMRLEEIAEDWTAQLRSRTESWLSASDSTQVLFYDSTWKTLVGYPASNGSETDLNDHHFHYGYHIQAAAALARADSTWGADWGPMVEMLIRDASNPDRDDPLFPFLRTFDPYAGHGIANGHAWKVGGYDQEASSESMNHSAAIIQWGLERGDDKLTDLGIWLYATERTAIEQYWFDVDDAVFPPSFDHTTNAILWGRGGSYDTWWSPEPAYIHGINYLPLTGASYYLGRHPDYVRRNDAELQEATAGRTPLWPDLSTMFFGLANPEEALQRFDAFSADYEPEEGGSPPHTYHWLAALNEVGTVDTTVTANVPAYRVFHNGKRRAYAAYNPRSRPARVRFSDGAEFRLPPRTQLTVCR